jgi:hypothetical protein
LEALAVSAPGRTPVPEAERFKVGFEAFEVKVAVPLAELADCGAKLTETVEVCPAAKVKGKLIPVMEKPVPEMTACEIVMLAPPVFVRVADCC